MTDDPGMKDMLGFLIARDTMHQQQWLAVVEELGRCKGAAADFEFASGQRGTCALQLRLFRP